MSAGQINNDVLDFFSSPNLPMSVQIGQAFTSDTIYNIGLGNVYSLAVDADITLQENGLVRIILVSGDQEKLVYEAYSSLNGAGTLNAREICEETCVMDGIDAADLKIQVENANLNLISIRYSETGFSQDIIDDYDDAKIDQDFWKISELNDADVRWHAGETSVSKKTYSEKKQLFRNFDGSAVFALPNLQGFEYYVGGVFEVGDVEPASDALPDVWDWRDMHGENWMTSVKNQGSCGSCWAFAATGATEHLANIYFNQHIDFNMAEQDALSCSGAGSCAGGWPYWTLDYYTETGVVDEQCFPYTARDDPCSNKCSSPGEILKIGGRIPFSSDKTEEKLKTWMIQYGAISGGIYSWSHAMAMAGWYTDTEGETVWIFKNSWGTNWGEQGYGYLKIPMSNFGWTHALMNPVTTLTGDYNILCSDKDQDRYCNWGIISTKPTTCPSSCLAEKDCDDSDPNLGPFDPNYNCVEISFNCGDGICHPLENYTNCPEDCQSPFPCDSCYNECRLDDYVTGILSSMVIGPARIIPASGPAGTVFTFSLEVHDNAEIINAKAQVIYNENPLFALDLYDDGLHNDGTEGDGIYANAYNSSGLANAQYSVLFSSTNEFNLTNYLQSGFSIGEINSKDTARLSKGVFLVSDKEWKTALQTIPAAIWTDDQIYKYPFLIFHEETDIDADSIIYFMQQYNPDKAFIVGSSPEILDELLLASPSLGAGLDPEDIEKISAEDLLSFWTYYNSVVYVQDNYELALLASTYASLKNIPLIIEGTLSDNANTFMGKQVICVGSVTPSGTSCSEQYDLQGLRNEYIEQTSTDKIILVNPYDLDIKADLNFYTEKTSSISQLFGKLSLAAPILASAKHELIVSHQMTGIPAEYSTQTELLNKFNEINTFIKTYYAQNFKPTYLTIIASHMAIPDSEAVSCSSCTSSCSSCTYNTDYRKTLDWQYISSDTTMDTTHFVGRIAGFSTSDVSAYVARSVFYDDIFNNIYPDSQFKDVSVGHSRSHYARDQETVVATLSGMGYSYVCYMDESSSICQYGTSAPYDYYKDAQFVTFADHGSPNGWSSTLYSNNIPWLKLAFMISKACSPNNLWRGKSSSFGAMAIRKGAIAVSAGSGVTPALPGKCSNTGSICYDDYYCSGGICESVYLPGSAAADFVSFDKTLTLGKLYSQLGTHPYISSQNSFKYYHKHLFLGDPTLQPRWSDE